jgi:hypothetical protein
MSPGRRWIGACALCVSAASLAALAPAAGAAPWFAPVAVSEQEGLVPHVALNARGDALVAWTGPGFSGVEIAERPAGAAFGPPRRLGDGRYPLVAMNESGEAVVGWPSEAGLSVAVRRAGGDFGQPRLFSEPEGAPEGYFRGHSVSIDPAGNAVVAWLQAPPADETGARTGERRVLAARRPAGAEFGAVETLGRVGAGCQVLTTMDASGRALVAWRGRLRSVPPTSAGASTRPRRRPARASASRSCSPIRTTAAAPAPSRT